MSCARYPGGNCESVGNGRLRRRQRFARTATTGLSMVPETHNVINLNVRSVKEMHDDSGINNSSPRHVYFLGCVLKCVCVCVCVCVAKSRNVHSSSSNLRPKEYSI